MLIRPNLSASDNRRIQAMLMGNQGGDPARQLLDGAPFLSELLYTAVPQRAASGTTATFTRATPKTIENNDGYLVTLASGEIGFPGARRVRNLQNTSSEPTSGWTAAGATPPTVTYTTLDGTGAVSMAFPVVAAGFANSRCTGPISGVSWVQNSTKISTRLVVSLSRALTGSEAITLYLAGTSALDDVIIFNASNTPTSATLQTAIDTFVNPSFTGTMGFIAYVSGAIVGSPVTLSLTRIQFEDVTGRADQTTPSEYVSVGVESAPAYHGSMVDGVKCFPTDLAGNALPTEYTYDAVSLNGVAGTYVSTPDSVAASITGDIDLRWYGVLNDWTPTTAPAALISKWDDAVRRSYSMVVYTDGTIRGFTSADGSTITNNGITSTASVGFSNGAVGGVRMTYATATGKFNFYTSTDGESWTLLGAADVSGTASAIFNSTSIVELGGLLSSTAWFVDGSVRKAQIYNGIDGTLAVDFDASRYAGGTTLTGSTGETWTLQGNAVIHPTNNPMLGYSAEGARTNLCLQSNAFTTTWAETGTVSATQNLAGPDGGTTGWTLTDNDSGIPEGLLQTYGALTAANYTQSLFIKKTVGATSFPVIRLNEPVSPKEALCTIDTNNGVATVWTAYTGSTIVTSTASCVSYNDDWWRVSLVFAATTASWRIIFYPAATTNAVQATGTVAAAVTGACGIYGAQVELGSFASSYIATTTVAVTRNADVEAVSTSGNIAAAAGSVYLEYTPTHSPSGTIAFWGTYVDASNYTAILHDATNLIFRKRIAGVNYDATIANAFVSGTTYKVCATWGTAGTSITLNGTEGTPHANTTAAQIAATMQWGADGNSLQQPFASIRNCRDWLRQLSASERAAVTA